jgi:RNA polymerase sigma-70 factor (ECF subfamily)
MPNLSESRTGTTLQVLLHDPTNPAAWKGFVERYVPKIYSWCRKWRLQEADAENVTQEVLTRLAQKLHHFPYDSGKGTFRGWLKTLTHHAWHDYREHQQRAGAGSGDTGVLQWLQTVEARDDLVKELKEAYERELWEAAQARVQLEVSRRDWQIFTDLVKDGRKGTVVAAEHRLTVAAVYMVRSRVQQKLKAAVQQLEESPPKRPDSGSG